MRKTTWQSALPSAVNRHEGATATPCLSPAYFSALEIPPDLPYHRFFTPRHKSSYFGFYSISDNSFPTYCLKADTGRMWREYHCYSAFIDLPFITSKLHWVYDSPYSLTSRFRISNIDCSILRGDNLISSLNVS
mgnify:CR=1 FL=1